MSFRVCQALFSKLFKFFRKFLSAACRPDEFYHTYLRLSRTFFRSSQRIYTLHFWAEFFDFSRSSCQSSSVCGLFCSALSSAWIYYHTISHLSTPFFFFFQKSSQKGNCVHFWLKTVQKPSFLVQNRSFSCYPFLSRNAVVFGTWTVTFFSINQHVEACHICSPLLSKWQLGDRVRSSGWSCVDSWNGNLVVHSTCFLCR